MRALAAALLILVTAVVGLASGTVQAATLVLTPDSAPSDSTVTGTQSVNPPECTTFRLRWGSEEGVVLGQDEPAAGTATVTFVVPDASPGSYDVVATCQADSEPEVVVGRTSFAVEQGLPEPTVVPPPPTTTGPSTTRDPGPGTTGTTATSTTLVPVGPPENFAECESRARQAGVNLVYNPELTMTVGETYRVAVALALNPFDPSSVTVVGPEETTVVPLPPSATGCLMEAELIGADFEISPPEPRAQSFTDATVLTWRWQVKPKREGDDLPLTLRLQPRFRAEGQEPIPGTEESFEAIIDVQATPRSLPARIMDRISAVFGNELVKYLFLPGGGGVLTLLLWKRFTDRKTGTST